MQGRKLVPVLCSLLSAAPAVPAPVKGYNTILVGTPYSTTNRDEICIR